MAIPEYQTYHPNNKFCCIETSRFKGLWQLKLKEACSTTKHGHFYFPGDLSLQLRQNLRDGVSNHQPHDCLLNRLFRRRSKKTSKLRITGFCAGKSPVTGEIPAQMCSNSENVSIWWRLRVTWGCAGLHKHTLTGLPVGGSL